MALVPSLSKLDFTRARSLTVPGWVFGETHVREIKATHLQSHSRSVSNINNRIIFYTRALVSESSPTQKVKELTCAATFLLKSSSVTLKAN